jgi:putative ABC transport system permease protein
MNYAVLVWKGIWRKPLRTVFSAASIAVAFLLFGLLQGINASFDEAADKSGADRLYVRNSVSDLEGLPISGLSTTESVPGVSDVAYHVLFPSFYRDPSDTVVAFAAAGERFFKVNKDLVVSPEALAALRTNRAAALVGATRAQREGWKVGQRISLQSTYWARTDGASDWTFDIVGVYADKDEKINFLTNGLLINYSYLDEARAFGKGIIGVFLVNVKDPANAGQVARAIDARFANSSWPTKTETIKAGVSSQLKQMGDVKFMVQAVVASVFFTLMFLTSNATMQSVRERTTEFAVMKTLGFSEGVCTTLMFTEVFMLYLVAALSGLGLAAFLLPSIGASFGISRIPSGVLATGLGIAVLLTVITLLLPIFSMRRIRLVDALAGR